MSRTVDIPPRRRGRRELVEDTEVRLGLHIKSRRASHDGRQDRGHEDFGLTVAAAAMLSLYYVPEAVLSLMGAAAVPPRTMAANASAKLEQKRLVTRRPSSDHAKVLIASPRPGEARRQGCTPHRAAYGRVLHRRGAPASPRCLGASPPSCATTSSPVAAETSTSCCHRVRDHHCFRESQPECSVSCIRYLIFVLVTDTGRCYHEGHADRQLVFRRPGCGAEAPTPEPGPGQIAVDVDHAVGCVEALSLHRGLIAHRPALDSRAGR